MQKTTLTPEAKFQAARLWATRQRPYFTTALLALNHRYVPGMDTFAVTANGTLLLGEAALDKWTVPEVGSVLIHEVEHVIRAHHGRAAAIPGVDPKVWNLAIDCEINDDCPDLQLPDGGWTPAVMRSMSQLPDAATAYADGLTGEAYYAAMMQEPRPPEQPDDKLCGSGAGAPNPNELPGEGAPRRSDKEGNGQSDSAGQGDWQSDGQGDGQSDGDTPGLTAEELASLRSEVALAVAAELEARQNNPSHKARGHIPGGLARWALERVAPPKVRWQDKLRRVCAQRTAEIVTGKQDTSFARPSRRQHLAPAGVVLRGTVGYQPLVAFVQDTSGSMSDAELAAGAAELEGIARSLSGARLHYLSADAAVCASGQVRGWRDVTRRALLKGGGGTDFRPAFDALARLPGGRPDLIVFHTDGYGCFPPAPPAGSRVVWVSTQAEPGHYPWGEVIMVPPER